MVGTDNLEGIPSCLVPKMPQEAGTGFTLLAWVSVMAEKSPLFIKSGFYDPSEIVMCLI